MLSKDLDLDSAWTIVASGLFGCISSDAPSSLVLEFPTIGCAQNQSNVRVRIDKYGETRVVTQPIKQCRRKRVSEPKLRIHDKYGETRIFFFEDMMLVGC